jgi:cytochrome c oxidase subunit 4
MEDIQVAIQQRVAEQERHHGKIQFFYVWGGLLVLTAIEVFLAYQNMQPLRMLTFLMGLSLIKAALIIAYFMHMKFEIARMKWTTMAALVICLTLMIIFIPDALRLLNLGVSPR